ncbi:MAG: DUF4366 domain-containing protein [Lachnospiraceae bacterium]|jgi:flagellar basal body-associated protein FliL|nr:DUF4366 domain-containing protein [Lachnospiraceae bacterium]
MKSKGASTMNTKKLEELVNSSALYDLLHKDEAEKKKKKTVVCVLAIVGAIAAIAGIAYAVYRFFAPDYFDDFEDDFEDEFDDDFFEEEPLESEESVDED